MEMEYIDDKPIEPEKPLFIKADNGYETYAIDKNTIGIRPKWISVEKELPKDNNIYYLVIFDKKRVLSSYFDGVFTNEFFIDKDDNFYMSYQKFHEYFNENITHWMPLPDAPKD